MGFVVSGRHVFEPLAVQQARKDVEPLDGEAVEVVFKTTETKQRRGRHVVVDVPTAWSERPRGPGERSDLYWRLWGPEDDERGQYVIVVDPASGEENTDQEPDFTAVQVLDHHTGVQVAEMETRAAPDLVAEQVFLMALRLARRPHVPLIVVEMTGGHGTSYVDRLWKEYNHPRMYFRKPVDPRRRDKSSDLVGFSTDRHTKPRLIDGMRELFRTREHGIRSIKLVRQAEAYQRNKKGSAGAAPGGHDDLLMAYMIGKYVMVEQPPRKDRSVSGVVSMATRSVRNTTTGY